MRLLLFALVAGAAFAQGTHPPAPATLAEVKRIYVAPLSGNQSADSLRQLIMSSIDSTKLFIVTDNPERADAELRGAADDDTYTDSYDSSAGLSARENGGKSASGTGANRNAGGYLGLGGSENESHHIRERKHEAYATVRLCNRDGDVLWSTTQESAGAKFRGASTDVATKIARQLSLDTERARSSEQTKK